MREQDIKMVLESVRDGKVSTDDAFSKLKNLPFEDLGFAKVDHHREIRTGYPEVIYCEGKSLDQIQKIIASLAKSNNNIMATRVFDGVYDCIKEVIPDSTHYEAARIVVAKRKEVVIAKKKIAVVAAGTCDYPVAEEAAVTAETLGNKVDRIYDVGVAGIHRLFARLDTIREANVIVAVAGMEGALVSVLGGLVDVPVVAVPVSVGYGTCYNGLSALLTMLNSCASGVGVMNIDNGFGGGYLASMINQMGD